MRLIDADALHKSIDTETYRHTYIDQIHEVIDDAPTIDAVPVVRCKDCIHAQKMNKPWADGRQIVFCWKHGKERFTTSDWYCACGERVKE